MREHTQHVRHLLCRAELERGEESAFSHTVSFGTGTVAVPGTPGPHSRAPGELWEEEEEEVGGPV